MACSPTKKTRNKPTNLTLKDPAMKMPVEDNQNHHRKLKDLLGKQMKKKFTDTGVTHASIG